MNGERAGEEGRGGGGPRRRKYSKMVMGEREKRKEGLREERGKRERREERERGKGKREGRMRKKR